MTALDLLRAEGAALRDLFKGKKRANQPGYVRVRRPTKTGKLRWDWVPEHDATQGEVEAHRQHGIERYAAEQHKVSAHQNREARRAARARGEEAATKYVKHARGLEAKAKSALKRAKGAEGDEARVMDAYVKKLREARDYAKLAVDQMRRSGGTDDYGTWEEGMGRVLRQVEEMEAKGTTVATVLRRGPTAVLLRMTPEERDRALGRVP